jgi:hypothetical protein
MACLPSLNRSSVLPPLFVTRKTFNNNYFLVIQEREELGGLEVSALRCAIAEDKQRWSVIGWVTKNLLCRAPPWLGRHVKPLVPVAFAVVSTHQHKLGPRGGLMPVLLMCNPQGRPVPQQWGH